MPAANQSSSRPGGPLADWPVVVVVGAAATVVCWLVGLPSPVLFGSLIGGLVQGVFRARRLEAPSVLLRTGQTLVGITVGSMVSLTALTGMGRELPEILLVTMGTLVISVAAGLALAARHDVSRVTGVFGLIAGGASGVVAGARELGADDRMVAVVQYLRVLAVLVTMPVVATVFFSPAGGAGGAPGTNGAPTWPSLGYVALAAALGIGAARLLRLPTPYLLGPLLLGAALGSSGLLGTVGVPVWLQWVGYALVGSQVGLRFTRESIASITRMLPTVLTLIALLIAGCAGLGALLAMTTTADPLTAYLATTPGGLWAVLALAADTGADVTYVTSVQLFRLLVILALAPAVARWLGGQRPGSPPGTGPG